MSTPQVDREEASRQRAIEAGARREFDAFLAARKTGDAEKIKAARDRFMRAMVGTRATFETELEGRADG
jgi:hypothetical protein